MAKYRVLLTRKIPQPAIDFILENDIELDINEKDRVMTKEEIMERVKGKDGLLCLLTDSIDEDILESAGEQLKVIANYAVGYNNIKVEAATERGIPVTNTPGVLTDTTADLAFALLFAIARKIVESDKYTREGKFKGWGPMLQLGNDIWGKTIGIIGMGRIGSAVAYRAAKGFNMKVLYIDDHRKPELEKELGLEYSSLEKILSESDFISLHVPLTDKTHYLFGEKEFKAMKESAYLINTSRGPVVNEKELADALKNKLIAGAALDVYEREPEVHPELITLDNVVITAHIGSASIETRTEMGFMAARNLIAGLKGEKPENCVNPEIYK